ncbi:MAG TPA: cysteine desulfurase-like protein [Gemmatimonadales bacterium]|jgi:cysteine desulfurase family protein (TIGR01976 family)
MSRVASTAAIREMFPALDRQQGGLPVAFFDGPGGTQVPRAVADAVADYLLHHNANTHWHYPTSAESDAMLWRARQLFADFMNGAPEEIVFGNNMTTITFHVARALAREWQAGDEVIVTEIDHHGNVAPWQAIAQERGVVLRWLPLDDARRELRLDLLPGLISPRTRLLAINAASNFLGTITDIPRATAVARSHAVLSYVDGVHYAPHQLPDVVALGCDFFACSAYKFHGPHVGVLWGRRELLDAIDAPRLLPAPQEAPERFETGTQNHEGIVGAGAAVEWLASLAGSDAPTRAALVETYRVLHDREMTLFDQLWRGLAGLPGVTCFGLAPEGHRTATIAFAVDGIGADVAAIQLATAGCFVSHGDFYATTIAERLGIDAEGVLRIGLACYSTADEVDRVVAGVAALAR